MRLELQDEKGLTGVFIELPLDQLRAEIGLVSSSAAEPTEAKAQLKESQDKVAELEEKLAKADGKTMDDFTQLEKATFVIPWGKGLSPENKVYFAEEVMEIPIAKAPGAAVAEGKPDPEDFRQYGCRYCEHLVTVSAPRKPWIGGCRYKLSFPDCGDKWQLWSGMVGKGKAKVAEEEPKAKAEVTPRIIEGKTDKPGYTYVELCDISIRERE